MDDFAIDPTKSPRKLEIEVPANVLERLEQKSAATGRCIDELILELIDQCMGKY